MYSERGQRLSSTVVQVTSQLAPFLVLHLEKRWESFCSSAVRSEITDSSWARESANRLECGVNVHISPPGNSGIDHPYLAGISVFCHSALQGI